MSLRHLSALLFMAGFTMNASALTLNQPSSNFNFSIASIWLQPGASNLNYVINNKELPTQSPTWHEQELEPGFAPGFNFGLGYQIPHLNNVDVHFDWTHLYSTTTGVTVADGVSFFLGPDYEIGPAGIPIRNAKGNAQFTYDIANLVLGKTINFGNNFGIRLFGGFGSGLLQENVNVMYTGLRSGVFAGPFSMNQMVSSRFTGIGPRVGMGAEGHCDSGFGITGEAGISALIGMLASHTNFVGTGVELTEEFGDLTNWQNITDQNVYQVIPGFDAKLGVDYQHSFYRSSNIKVTLGYETAVYINAISQYLPGSLVSGAPLESGGIFVATMSHTLSNYSVQGPFLEFAFTV